MFCLGREMRSVSVRSNIGELRQLTVRKIVLAQFSILSFEIFSFFVSSRSHDRPTAGPRPNSTTSYGTGTVEHGDAPANTADSTAPTYATGTGN